MQNQRGLIKEIVVIVAVIFIMARFNIDPASVWDTISEFFIELYDKFKT